jgi:hypothetical protein
MQLIGSIISTLDEEGMVLRQQSITRLSITTLSIMTLSITTLSTKAFRITINETRHSAQ